MYYNFCVYEVRVNLVITGWLVMLNISTLQPFKSRSEAVICKAVGSIKRIIYLKVLVVVCIPVCYLATL